MLFGFCFGVISWFNSISTGDVTSTGTVMIAVMPIIMGFQLLLSSLHYDITNSPLHPLQKK
ncbi:glycosyltransferase family 2 protein, partial [Vibrio sp. 10N.222.51.A6]